MKTCNAIASIVVLLILFILPSCMLNNEHNHENITLDDIAISDALYFSANNNMREYMMSFSNKSDEYKLMNNDQLKAHARKYLGDNNFLSFLLTMDKFPVGYDIVEIREDYDPIFDSLLCNQSPITEKSIYGLRTITRNNEKMVGSFEFNVCNVLKGRCLFNAAYRNDGELVVNELRLARTGSDKLEDGILVYSASK